MPNFDGGHAFFTALIPVRADPEPQKGADPHDPPRSRVAALREELALLPIAKQSPASADADMPESPFARAAGTHFARFVVVDDAVFNGRDPQDALSNAIFGPNLTVPQNVDHLSNAYLFFAADIDAPEGREAEVDAWLKSLWEEGGREMRAVFRHCHGFEAGVKTAADFAAYVRRGQIETTMSFNDYFEGPPPLQAKPIKWQAAPAILGAGLAALGFGGIVAAALQAVIGASLGGLILFLGAAGYLLWLWRAWTKGAALFSGSILNAVSAIVALGKGTAALAVLFTRYVFGGTPPLALWSYLLLLGVIVFAGGALYLWRYVQEEGAKPFPPAPNSDLKSVLKALYLQQRFISFAAAHQTADAEALHKAFGDFLKTHKPSDVTGPTQKPGVVRSEGGV